MKCTVYGAGSLKDYKFAVTFARYEGKWLICKQKGRSSWETSGGHIEPGESPLEAAKRELYEETGALDFDIKVVCDFWSCYEPHETENINWANSQVFYASIRNIGDLPESEMECIDFVADFPTENLSYPEITGAVLPWVKAFIGGEEFNTPRLDESKDELKISDMLKSQYELWEKHKDKWSPMTPVNARNSLLWMIDELGEVIAIIKKKGEEEILANSEIKEHFLEELVDVFMYFLDVLLRYGFTGVDFSDAYRKKSKHNLKRDYSRENREFLSFS